MQLAEPVNPAGGGPTEEGPAGDAGQASIVVGLLYSLAANLAVELILVLLLVVAVIQRRTPIVHSDALR